MVETDTWISLVRNLTRPGPATDSSPTPADGQSSAAEARLRDAIRHFPAEQKAETAAALRRLAGLWQADGRHPEATRALLQRAESLER